MLQAHLTQSLLIKLKPFIPIKLLPPKNFIASCLISSVMIKIDLELYQTPFMKISFLKNKKLFLYFLKSLINSTLDNFRILTLKSEKDLILKFLIGKIFILIMTALLKEIFSYYQLLENQHFNNKLNPYKRKMLQNLSKLFINNNKKLKSDSSLIISLNFIHLFSFLRF
mgnify:CR=1 FL=1